VTLQPRKVRIGAIDVLAFHYPRVEIEVHCGKGTYIRSLARDLGDKMGCGALVETLRRTRIGPFTLGEALPLDTTPAVACARLLPLSAAVAELPVLELTRERLQQLTVGQAIPFTGAQSATARLFAVLATDGRLCALARWDPEQCLLQPAKVFSVIP
jgi:tRNA pseudouridine55 synthase